MSRKSTSLTYAGYTLEEYENSLMDKSLKDYEKDTLVLTGTTLSKLLSFLSLNANRLFVHHEISGFLTDMGKQWNVGFRQTITELFDGINRTMSNQERTEKIVNPALSIAAASTEGWLYKNVLDTSDQMSGFMQRMIFYVVKQIPIEDISFEHKEGDGLRYILHEYENKYYTHWRALPGQSCLSLSDEAKAHKNKIYENEYLKYYRLGNDNLMSYFTRVFDNYLFKFCMLIWLTDFPDDDRPFMKDHRAWEEYTRQVPVTLQQFKQAWYLCRFYMANVIPLLNIIDERDKLQNERKLIDLLVNRFGGRGSHSALLNASHMKKREFTEAVESLIERDAITCETGEKQLNNRFPKMYVLNPEIMSSWNKEEKAQLLALNRNLQFNEPVIDE